MQMHTDKSNRSSPSLADAEICRSIINQSNAIVLTLSEGDIVDANAAAIQMFGYSLAELREAGLMKIFDGSLLQHLNYLEKKGITQLECYGVRKNGQRFFCEISSSFVTTSTYPQLISFSIIDVSRLQEIEAKRVRDANDRARELIERVSDSFVSLDKNFRFTYVNQRAAQMANLTVDSLLGNSIWEMFPDIVGSEIYVAFHRAMIEQQYVSTEFYYQPFDIWLQYHIYPSSDGVSAFIRDITEHKRQQELDYLEKEILEFYTNTEIAIEETLTLLLNRVREIHPQMCCSILRVHDNKLFTWVSPHLPEEFNNIINGMLVAYGSGSCGTAAYIKEPIMVDDIMTNPLTKDYLEIAEKIPVKSCWSYPILDSKKNVLATFAVYYPTQHTLKKSEEQTINKAATILRNILLNKTAYDAVIKSEEVRRLIMNSALDAIVCIDVNGLITLWNPQAEKIFGWKETEVLGKELDKLIIPEKYRHQHRKGIDHYHASGEGPILNKLLEVSAVGKNRSEFPISLTVVAVKQMGSEFFCAFIEDITEKKEAQFELQKANTQLMSAQQIAKLGYWELDLIGNNHFWTDQIFDICGLQKGKVKPSLAVFAELIHPDDKEEFIESYSLALQGVPLLRPEYRLLDKDGTTRYVLVEATRVCDETGNPIRLEGTLQDITRLKENELALTELNAKLNKHAEELAKSNSELEQFAYITSHDLQEPLRMVTSFLTQIEKKYNDLLDEKGRQYIFFAIDGAERMKRIIKDLLEYSRVGKIHTSHEQVDMNVLMEEVVLLNQATIQEKGAEIVWEKLPVLHFAKMPLQQVLHNLVSNALKYQKEANRPTIEIKVKEMLMHWQFSVTDNGIGIDPKHFDKIFILFRRLHNREEYSGTGLGLAICKKIIETHHGNIWLESVPGVGTTFYFTIPKQFSKLNP